MNDNQNGHAKRDDGAEICWTLLLRPKLQQGCLPDQVDLSPPPPTGMSKCVGAYPLFRVFQVSDCACGLIGDGKSVLDIEHYIRTFSGRKGVSNVEIAWYWGAKAPSSTRMEHLAFDTFCRLNEAKSLEPDTWYDIPLPARAQPHAED